MFRRILFTGIVLAAVALAASSASAQDYGPDFTVGTDDDTVVAGEQITLSGTCVEADEVTFEIDGRPLGSAPVDDSDQYSGTVTVPSDLAPGTHTINAHCGTQVQGVQITVGAAGDDGAGTPTARTGSDIEGPLRLGATLVVIGGAAVFLAVRRRHSLSA